MRYPVGFRPTLQAAYDAAAEAAKMTGIRYHIAKAWDAAPEVGVYEAWGFAPVETPDPTLHMAVRV